MYVLMWMYVRVHVSMLDYVTTFYGCLIYRMQNMSI